MQSSETSLKILSIKVISAEFPNRNISGPGPNLCVSVKIKTKAQEAQRSLIEAGQAEKCWFNLFFMFKIDPEQLEEIQMPIFFEVSDNKAQFLATTTSDLDLDEHVITRNIAIFNNHNTEVGSLKIELTTNIDDFTGKQSLFNEPATKISKDGPNHVYELEEAIDDWERWTRFKDYANGLNISNFKTSSIFSLSRSYSNPQFQSILKDFRNVLKATFANSSMGCSGRIDNDEIYISLGCIPSFNEIDGIHLQVPQYAFGWKQKSRGKTYVASPVVLDALEKEEYIILPKDVKELNNEILKDYKKVSTKFLSDEKRKFISSEPHIQVIDFIKRYLQKESSVFDLTNLSARARIYILKEIINFKKPFQDNPDYWKKEQKTKYGIHYWEWIDLKPTTFKIDKYEYVLENAITANKPGGGRIKGLRENIVDKYDKILQWLETREDKLNAFKTALIERQEGKPVKILNPNTEQVDEPTSRFINGLSLLFDYEVARRLITGDCYEGLPVLPAIPYLLDNFQDTRIIRGCFDELFSGKTMKVRSDFIKNVVIETRRNLDTEKRIRESLKLLHSSSENSDDEYTD